MLHWSSLAVLVVGLLSVGPVGIRAQDSTAVCLPSLQLGWMNNSKKQDPCVVTSYLTALCNGGPFTLLPLPVGGTYRGPYAGQADQCQCSMVTYNTISACALCQNRKTISWSSWSHNCTPPYLNDLPGIPNGTAVPHWAYQNVPTNGSFNVMLAQSVGDTPESTATVPQSSSTSPSILPTGSSSSKTNVGAIAGGVVGGVIGVALIVAVVVFFIVRKRRSQIPPSAQLAGYPPPYNGYASQPKLYDPSDPSTFPVTPPPPTGSIANVPTSFVTYSSNTPSLRPATGGAYTGVPEV